MGEAHDDEKQEKKKEKADGGEETTRRLYSLAREVQRSVYIMSGRLRWSSGRWSTRFGVN